MRVRLINYGFLLLALLVMATAVSAEAEKPRMAAGGPAGVQALSQQPAQGADSAPNYRVNPGDVLDIAFRWTPEFNQTVTVQPDGHVILTSAGDIKMGGLTLLQVRDLIINASSSKVVNPEVAVTLKDFERPRIAIGGEVVTPGKYDLRQPTTALQAIMLAGGPKDSAQLSQILLFRPMPDGMSEVHRINFHHLDHGKHPPEDIQLKPGDMLLIPRDKLTKIGRYVRTFNLGVYFNPATGAVF
ncbi:polysaccharide biosynthesis/export family protein [Granulicella tundricola]|nr:polysaccharide biosynthesis/export family protein [Granulicella tundricola]